MGRKEKPKKPLQISKRPTRQGQKSIKNQKIVTYSLYKKIRKRLDLKVKELGDREIDKIIDDVCYGILDWIVNNPEGFEMPFEMGYLALTKYILIPFREDRWEIINRIKNLSENEISDRFREIVLKRYNKELTKDEIYHYMKRGKVKLNAIWFNKRNCSIRKAACYRWMPPKHFYNRIRKLETKDYYYLKFDDFYNYKVKPEE